MSDNSIDAASAETPCVLPLPLIIAALVGWIEREQRDLIEFLREEDRVSRRSCAVGAFQLTDDERRRLAVLGARLGRRILAEVVTIVTPDTILRWHRQLIARKWTHLKRRISGSTAGRPAQLLHGPSMPRSDAP